MGAETRVDVTMKRLTSLSLIAGFLCLSSLMIRPAVAQDLTTMLSKFLVDLRAGTLGVNNTVTSLKLVAGSTATAPGIQISGSTVTGIYDLGPTNVGFTVAGTGVMGVFAGTTQLKSDQSLGWASSTINTTTDTKFGRNGAGLVYVGGATLGSTLKADALPTVNSGFGTSPSVGAGSTALAGSVNVGTGGVATSGTLLFNGTAFPSAPFCTVTTNSSTGVPNVSSSTTQLSLGNSVAWAASTVVYWICVSPR